MTRPPISKIGKYEVLDLIGEGAMGVVYRAMDPVLGRPVAVKVMSDGIARDDELRERFVREARAAGSLQHPNVVTIYELGEMDGHLFIAMELVEGRDLETLMTQGETLALDRKLEIATDLLAGLDYAHKRGIVHRDVKPANIRIAPDGRAKIMDFGIAHLASSNATRTGVMMGTPNYMSPEQVSGGTITAATDIFSAGGVLYELLSGHRPFRADSLHAVLFKVLSEEPKSLADVDPSLPPGLAAIVQRALAKDPAARFDSALEMANAITAVRAATGGSPTQTISLGASLANVRRAQLTVPPTPKRARAAAIAAGIVVLVGGGLWFAARTRDVPAASAPSASLPTSTELATADTAKAPIVPPPITPASRTTEGNAPSSAAKPVALPPTVRENASASAAKPSSTPDTRESEPATLPAPPRPNPDSAAAALAAAQLAKSTPPPVVPPPVSTTPTQAPIPAPTPAPVERPSVEIERLVGDYARAIESREVGAVKRIYAGMSDAQQKGFEDFFRSVRSLRVSFTLDGLDVNGAAAEGRLMGAYDYISAAGKSEHQPVRFRATFAREGGQWRIVAVR